MNEKTGSGKLLNAQQLLDQLFDAESKPSLRWLREQTRARSIPFVRIGHLVFFDLDIVRSALAERHMNRGSLGARRLGQ
jgi:hypothetical protein